MQLHCISVMISNWTFAFRRIFRRLTCTTAGYQSLNGKKQQDDIEAHYLLHCGWNSPRNSGYMNSFSGGEMHSGPSSRKEWSTWKMFPLVYMCILITRIVVFMIPVQALTSIVTLCSWEKHFTLTVFLFSRECEWVLVICYYSYGQLTEYWGFSAMD